MDEAGVDAQENALAERVTRLEAELAVQRGEVDGLRAELYRLGGRPHAAARPTLASQTSTPVAATLSGPLAPAAAAYATFPLEAAAAAKPRQSLENKLGSQVFNRIGIVAILIGATWFLKLAIDNQWIGPLARILIGLLAGTAIVLWSERFRRKGFSAFSYSLKAVGTGVLYLSLWASFHLYHLLPADIALVAMIGVTAWNAVMAWSQDAELLAVYALIGGFATPALLGTGGNHEVFLFSYVLAMDVAVLILLIKKPWQALLLGSFPATVGYFIGWYVRFYAADEAGLTAMFVVLLAAPFITVALTAKQRESVLEGIVTPLCAAGFLGAGLYSVLEDSSRHTWLPWVAVALAALYLALMRVRRGSVATAMHLSLATVFLTIAIPLKAEGRWITVGWLVEAVALLWIAASLKSERRVLSVLRGLGFAALLLGVIGSLSWPWYDTTTAFLNRTFATECAAMAALAAAVWLGLRMKEEAAGRLTGEGIAAASFILLDVVLLVAMYREIFRYFESGASSAGTHRDADFSFSAWMMAQAAALLVLGFWKRRAFVRWQGLALLIATIGKVFLYDMRSLSSGYRVLSFIGLGVLLMAVSFAYQKDWLGLREADAGPGHEEAKP